MRMLARLPIAAVVGGGFFVGGHVLFDSLSLSPEQQNQQFEACASQLGSIAVIADRPPTICREDFSDDYFSSKTTTVDVYNAKSGNTTETSKTVYFLPSKAEFIHNNVSTPAEINSENFRLRTFYYAMDAFIAGVGTAGALVMTSNRRT